MRKKKIKVEESIETGNVFIFKYNGGYKYTILFVIEKYIGKNIKGKGKKGKDGPRVSFLNIELVPEYRIKSEYKDYALSTFRLELANCRYDGQSCINPQTSMEESKLAILVQCGKSIDQLIREAVEKNKLHKMSNCDWYQKKIAEEQRGIERLEKVEKVWTSQEVGEIK